MEEKENGTGRNSHDMVYPAEKREILQPAGWLVTVREPDFGKVYPLRCGKNSIGRAEAMDVAIRNDQTVSRQEHAWIEYRRETKAFVVSTGRNRSLIYINDDPVFKPTAMRKNDILYVGDTELMLIPCCDEKFCWEDCQQ